ncbi:hypothetical protein CPC735_011000 [Coccidioides posadasii C735 delta SOWgp]|uniref:Uncharacterized protein n=2 Tax=Coccidioides posadasii TaxID=199306 RepID=A0A0J6FGS4_COCPO|nr:hypothetical protein CPC735_011000 [Coccidioides posadasii C735 delta SOWgp]EER26921.1 hypothetical protein CPC735_011000 [Coccidioides posadasii C735 delta SOWgp]KMM72336.1 hypothetical protein CPAG_08633 [Coccidioides posadasii RMSCC 3488]|eukprot:XP_003069066.1 hypothetical protein CPC735_011000 [Coccidioides posadasii C735 delta SOWgp]
MIRAATTRLKKPCLQPVGQASRVGGSCPRTTAETSTDFPVCHDSMSLRTERSARTSCATRPEIEWTAVNHGWFMDYFVQGSKVDPTTLPYGFSGRSPATAGQGENDNNSKDIDFSIPRSYMQPLPGIWPLDLDSFTATRLGTGNEAIGWTSARDVARALVRLVQAPAGSWEKHTYVAGEIGTWNRAISKVEKFLGRKFVVVDPPSE